MKIRRWGRIKDYTRTIQNLLGVTAVILTYRWTDHLQLARGTVRKIHGGVCTNLLTGGSFIKSGSHY